MLLPASLPFIVSGLKQGWAFAWRSLITAEMLYLSLGLGQVLMMGRDLNDMSPVIAVMILIIALGYIVDGMVFKGMERHLQNKWGLTARQLGLRDRNFDSPKNYLVKSEINVRNDLQVCLLCL